MDGGISHLTINTQHPVECLICFSKPLQLFIKMLTEEQKSRILNEETYRIEVKRELESKNREAKSKVVRFLNPNLGIFILSSCLLSFITWGYTTYSNHLRTKAINNSQLKKIEYEVASRIETISKMKDSCDYNDIDNIRYAI